MSVVLVLGCLGFIGLWITGLSTLQWLAADNFHGLHSAASNLVQYGVCVRCRSIDVTDDVPEGAFLRGIGCAVHALVFRAKKSFALGCFPKRLRFPP